jgi:FkbM family methyltransferase
LELIATGIAGIVVTLGVTLYLLILLRRAGRRTSLAEQQTRELKQQVEEQARKVDEQARKIDEQARRIDEQAQAIAAQEQRSAEFAIQLTEEFSRGEALAARVLEMTEKIAALAESVEILRRLPPCTPPIDAERLQKMPEKEMVALAESTACLRPLVAYPNWRFDIDWANPDLAFQLRRQVWQGFHDRRIEAPVTMGWHLSTRLQLGLRSDLSRQIYVGGCIDPNEFVFLNHYLQPGMTFFDVGANEGIYTVFAASRVGESGSVRAFEPSPREFERLKANLDLNGLNRTNIGLYPVALADCNGYVDLTVAEAKHAGQNTLGVFANAGIAATSKQSVPVRRLDDLLAEDPPLRIDVVKLDVEGAELRTLEGAAGTLRKYRPVVLLEVSAASLRPQGASRQGLLAFLRSLEYTFYKFGETGLPAIAEEGSYSDNMLAVPAGTVLPPSVFEPWPVG